MTIDPPGPHDIAAGLRRFADFVEAQADDQLMVKASLILAPFKSTSERQVANIAEACDVVGSTSATYEGVLDVMFGGLTVNLYGSPRLFGEPKETVETVTKTVPFSRDELIARGRTADDLIAAEPF